MENIHPSCCSSDGTGDYGIPGLKQLDSDSEKDGTILPEITDFDFLFEEQPDESSTLGGYAANCPYRVYAESFNELSAMRNRFRLIETFSDGMVYIGDSFGSHSYIDANEERACSQSCFCRQHDELPNAFAFVVEKSSTRLDVTIYSAALYSEVVRIIGLENLQEQSGKRSSCINGFTLLGFYRDLQASLNILQNRLITDMNATSSFSDMVLLVDGLLMEGDIFKSFGFENLYEDGYLSFEHWKSFQQDQFRKDISALDEGYCAIDYAEERVGATESRIPTELLDLQLAEIELTDVDSGEGSILFGRQNCSRGIETFGMLDDPRISTQQDLASDQTHIEPGSFKSEGINPVDLQNQVPSYVFADYLDGPLRAFSFSLSALPRPLRSTRKHRLDLEQRLDSALLIEAKAGNDEAVISLLNQGAGRNQYNPSFLTRYHSYEILPMALSFAAANGHENTVRLLLTRGAHASDRELLEASKAGHINVVRLLLPRLSPWDVDAALISAASAGYKMTVRAILDREDYLANAAIVMALDSALKFGHEGVMEAILDRGVTETGKLLVQAAKDGNEAVVTLLLDRESSAGRIGKLDSSNWEWHRYKMISVIEAGKSGQKEIVRLLLQRGAAGNDLESLMPPLAERDRTFLRLHEQFAKEHILMSETLQNSSAEFGELDMFIHNRRETWQAGIRTMRRLCNGKPPRDLFNAAAFLCISKAMSETLDLIDGTDHVHQFLEDLDRWQILFISEPKTLEAYRELVRSTWGITLSQNTPRFWKVSDFSTLSHFQALLSTLIRQTSVGVAWKDSFRDQSLESSQQSFRLRNKKSTTFAEQQLEILHPDSSGGSNEQSPEMIEPGPPNIPTITKDNCLKEKIDKDKSVAHLDTNFVFLMAGTIFAIVIIFLQWIRNISANLDFHPLTGDFSSSPSIRDLQARCLVLATYLNLKPHFAFPSPFTIALCAETTGLSFNSDSSFSQQTSSDTTTSNSSPDAEVSSTGTSVAEIPTPSATQILHKLKRQCPICKKKVLASNLKRHMKDHSGENKVPCRFCGKILGRKEYAQRHEKKCNGKMMRRLGVEN